MKVAKKVEIIIEPFEREPGKNHQVTISLKVSKQLRKAYEAAGQREGCGYSTLMRHHLNQILKSGVL